MPEAAMHENDRAVSGKGKVRLSGKILGVKAVPVAERVDKTAHNELRASILAPNLAHKLRAPFWVNGVQLAGNPYRGFQHIAQLCARPRGPMEDRRCP